MRVAGREEAGEDLGDEGFERGEAGADDADVRFDARPHGRGRVVPGDVGGDGDGVEGLEAEAGDDDDAVGERDVDEFERFQVQEDDEDDDDDGRLGEGLGKDETLIGSGEGG